MNAALGYMRPHRGNFFTKSSNILVLAFTLACFTLAGYMGFLQFKSYLRNEDSTAISYELFEGDDDRAYPTFSACLYKGGGAIFQTGVGTKLCSYPCNNSTYRNENSKTCREKVRILISVQGGITAYRVAKNRKIN